MKILKRTFIFPVLIHKTSTGYSGKPDISLRLRKSKMAGTMKTTAYTLQIVTKKNEFQWSFVWRPDVTRYWWGKEVEDAKIHSG